MQTKKLRTETITPDVFPDKLHHPDPEHFKFGTVAPNIPNNLVDGRVHGRIAQDPIFDDDKQFPHQGVFASTTVDVTKEFVIDVYWDLSGKLVPAFGGSWAITIFFDCEMNPDFDLQIQSEDPEAVDYDPDNPLIPFGCPDNNGQSPYWHYHARFTVPENYVGVTNAHRGTPYEVSISVVKLDPCNNRPTTGIVGFVNLEAVLFYTL